jgi:hypothetical protein
LPPVLMVDLPVSALCAARFPLVPVFAGLLVLLPWAVFALLDAAALLLDPLALLVALVLLPRAEPALRFAFATSATSPHWRPRLSETAETANGRPPCRGLEPQRRERAPVVVVSH